MYPALVMVWKNTPYIQVRSTPQRVSSATCTYISVHTYRHGIRNSLLLAPMPTASTAQILGNNESFEPYTSNIYSRRVLSGEFQVVNHHLLKDLTEQGLWDETMKQRLIANNGSIQVRRFVCPQICVSDS